MADVSQVTTLIGRCLNASVHIKCHRPPEGIKAVYMYIMPCNQTCSTNISVQPHYCASKQNVRNTPINGSVDGWMLPHLQRLTDGTQWITCCLVSFGSKLMLPISRCDAAVPGVKIRRLRIFAEKIFLLTRSVYYRTSVSGCSREAEMSFELFTVMSFWRV